MPDLVALLKDQNRIAELPHGEAALALVRLTEIQLAITAHLTSLSPHQARPVKAESEDRLLTPAAAAERLGVSLRWLYRQSGRLPFTRRLTRKTLRFSEAGLRKYLAETQT